MPHGSWRTRNRNLESVTANPTSIGFLGLGHMGASVAERLLASDIKLYVFDTRQEAMEPFVKRGANEGY